MGYWKFVKLMTLLRCTDHLLSSIQRLIWLSLRSYVWRIQHLQIKLGHVPNSCLENASKLLQVYIKCNFWLNAYPVPSNTRQSFPIQSMCTPFLPKLLAFWLLCKKSLVKLFQQWVFSWNYCIRYICTQARCVHLTNTLWMDVADAQSYIYA